MQVDLVDKYDAGDLVQGSAFWRHIGKMADEVAHPPNKGLVPIRERTKWRRHSFKVEQVLVVFWQEFAPKVDVLG